MPGPSWPGVTEARQTVPSRHLARAVHEATLPPAQDDFEYHITAETAAGQTLVWPATAPDLNQSVIIH